MPTRETTPPGAPCWIDLQTSDPERATTFYVDLFGWTAETSGPGYGDYVTFLEDGATIAGMAPSEPGNPYSDVWTVYLATADADATTRAATGAGGRVLMEPMTVPDQGRLGMFADPSGAVVGIWQPLGHAGLGVVGEVGTPVWFELSTRDYDAVLPFYRSVFGWQTEVLSDTGGFRYSTARFGGEDLAGVFDGANELPAEVPSHWQVYIGVPDTDAAAARVAELGGLVLREPWDSRYGRMAQVADPNGAPFLMASV